MTNYDLSWNADKLRRKIDQAYELAGYARQDRDAKDEAKQLKLAKLYEARLAEIR